jgi:hypothetical protein
VLKNFFYCKIVIYLHADFQRFKMIYKIAAGRLKISSEGLINIEIYPLKIAKHEKNFTSLNERAIAIDAHYRNIRNICPGPLPNW